jgi:hypothetical protein
MLHYLQILLEKSVCGKVHRRETEDTRRIYPATIQI